MDETRAIARLPHLDVEIWHRQLPEEQSEQLAISLKATPSFGDFAHFARVLERQAPWPWLALQPWLMWGQIAQAVWQPWLAAPFCRHGGPLAAAERPPRAQSRFR
jgi:hypothetical protein